MKLKELKNLIEGCHPEDLNNDVEAVVISKKNKVFKSQFYSVSLMEFFY